MVNSVVLVGRVGKTPELKYTESGTAVAKFSIALDRPTKDKETDWFDITAWGMAAEFVGNYVTKGSVVGVNGRLVQEKWEKDGQKRTAVRVHTNAVQSIVKGREAQSTAGQDEQDPFANQ